MDMFVEDIRIVIAIAAIAFFYAAYEIYRMRLRARQSMRPERRSIVGIVIVLGVLAFVVAVLIPAQRQSVTDKQDSLQQQMQDQEERVRQLEQGESTDPYQ